MPPPNIFIKPDTPSGKPTATMARIPWLLSAHVATNVAEDVEGGDTHVPNGRRHWIIITMLDGETIAVFVRRIRCHASAIRLSYFICRRDMTIVKESLMKRMATGLFTMRCLAIMDEVEARRKAVVITPCAKASAKIAGAGKGGVDMGKPLERLPYANCRDLMAR